MSFEKPLLAGVMFALALRVSSVLHEGAHALVGWLYGASFTVSNFAVHARGVSPRVAIVMAAAGPLYSLLQGVACLGVLQAIGMKSSALRLLVAWLALHGLSAGFGYLLTPFGNAGDVAIICRLIGVGNGVRAVLVLAGAVGILWTGWSCATLLMPFAEPGAALDDPDARARLLLRLAVVPWWVGTLIALAFAWPFDNRFGLLYELASGAFTLAAYRFARRASAPASRHGWPETSIWPWVLLTAAVMLASRLTIGRPQ